MWKLLFILIFISSYLTGTQTALFWTYATTDVVPTGKGNFEMANLFRAVNNQRNNEGIFVATVPGAMLPTDVGFDVGLFTWGIWEAEIGLDYYGGISDPVFFNAKIAVGENKLFCGAPSFSVGMINIGTARATNFDTFDFCVGKSLPKCWGGGRIFIGGYYGNIPIGKDRGGWWVGYDLPFYKKTSHKGVDYYRWHFLADYASGKNLLGGGGFGLSYFINPDITIATGPTWFHSTEIYGTWKWAIYLNVVFPVFRKERCCR